MGSSERRVDRATRRARQVAISVGTELREARLAAGMSQERVAAMGGVSRPWYTRLEAGSIRSPRLLEIARVSAVLGLDLVVKVYAAGSPLRDEAHASRLERLLTRTSPPLRPRREMPLPRRDGRPEQRAWDAALLGGGMRTCLELEMRLRDAQAQERRIALKRQDDPPDRFLLAIAGTTANRRVLRENPGLFADLPRLRLSVVIRELTSGRHPPTGLILL